MRTLRGIVKTLRPHQWVKNLFVAAPLVFGKKLDDPHAATLAVGPHREHAKAGLIWIVELRQRAGRIPDVGDAAQQCCLDALQLSGPAKKRCRGRREYAGGRYRKA